ncbi:MAG: hypothetical protein K0S34_1168 [Bacillales bacterium]|jgi:hypothetical protein|nr:hypothetical protein [Bacillales bacterium]
MDVSYLVSRDTVERKLKLIQYIISNNSDNFVFRSDLPKNEATLIALGFRPNDAIEVIKGLVVEDYSKGPEKGKSNTRNVQEEIWFFGKRVEGFKTMEVYIKFSIYETNQNTTCYCISFHEAEFEINYPLK